jgi:hypothetical protein
VLRAASDFMLTLAPGAKMTCADAVKRLVKDKRRREVRSAGKGSKGGRWHARAWDGSGRDYFGPGQCQARLCTAIRRHLVLVMAALAICAVTAARLRDRTGTQAPPPVTPGQAPPREPGMIPLTVHEVKRLPAAALDRPAPDGHAARRLSWRRRHQARSRWFHQRARLNRDYALVSQQLAAAVLGRALLACGRPSLSGSDGPITRDALELLHRVRVVSGNGSLTRTSRRRLGGMTAQIGTDGLDLFGEPRPELLAGVVRVRPEPGGEWVNIEDRPDRPGFRSTQRLWIGDVADGVAVATWPAELAPQARYLYGGGLGSGLVAVAIERGWTVEPSPHIAYRTSPPGRRLYMRPSIAALDYVAFLAG